MRYPVCKVGELKVGTMRPFDVGGVELLIVHSSDGQISALLNRCSHRGARLSFGRLTRQTVGDQVGERSFGDSHVILCPWHGFEYDVATGRCPADPQRVRVRVYPVSLEDGVIFVER